MLVHRNTDDLFDSHHSSSNSDDDDHQEKEFDECSSSTSSTTRNKNTKRKWKKDALVVGDIVECRDEYARQSYTAYIIEPGVVCIDGEFENVKIIIESLLSFDIIEF